MSNRGKLSKSGIIKQVMGMLDDQGADTFSMRKLAAALKVDPMAIYHHFPGKAELMHAVMQAMLDEIELPPATGVWQNDIRNLCNSIRKIAHLYPGSFQVYETYARWLPGEHKLHEAFHLTLKNAGFSRIAIVQSARVLLSYAESTAIDEIAGWLVPADVVELENSLHDGDYPTLIDLLGETTAQDAAGQFGFGLDLLISGLEQMLKRYG